MTRMRPRSLLLEYVAHGSRGEHGGYRGVGGGYFIVMYYFKCYEKKIDDVG